MSEQSEWGFLSSNDFSNLDVLNRVAPEAVQGLLSSCEMRSLGKGEILIEAGTISDHLYLILEGELQVFLANDSSTAPIVLNVGQTVGELSVIDHHSSSALVTAAQFTRVLVVPEAMFWRLIDVSHEFARNMLILLSHRMRTDNTLLQESIIAKNMFELQTTLDPLTGLHNRRWIDLNLPKLINRSIFGKEPLSIMMIDIDHFKQVNDTYGHLKGDHVLRMVASIIRDSIRPLDFACRYGGEEFLVIFPQTAAENARIPAERIRRQVEKRSLLLADQQDTPAVTISGGIATLQELHSSEKAEEIMERVISLADKALYHGKESGRNCIIPG